jgi:tetratricopeptide (TPR) repeat protein
MSLEMGADSTAPMGMGLAPLGADRVVNLADAPFLAQLLRVDLATTPLEAQLLNDAADGQLDDWTLARAALVAGGAHDPAAIDRYLVQLRQWSSAARANDHPNNTPRRRAAALLEWMHARLLRAGYQIDATDLAGVLERGQFNCVSATVLFMALGGEIGLDVTAVELPTHAFCRVTAGDDSFDVEPTCRRWFEVIDDPQARTSVTRRIAGASPDAVAVPRSVSPAQLLAVIYYNRGVDLIRHGDDAGAIAVNLKALSLDPQSATARGNLWVAVNNAALGLCRNERYKEAADLAARARQAVPQHAALAANELYIYQQWGESLSRRQQFAEAIAVLEAGLARQPESLVLARRRDEALKRLNQQRATPVAY